MLRSIFVFFAMVAPAAIISYAVLQPSLFESTPSVVDLSEISLNTKGERVYQEELFTGEAVSHHASGHLASAEQFVNGRRQGYSKIWFESGILGFDANYKNGLRDGYSRSWWFNGNPRSEVLYENGRKEGLSLSWYQSGAPFKKVNYVAGRLSGIQQGWRENGKLFSNFEYRNGRVYGLQKANTCIGLEDEVLSVDYYKNQES